MHIICMFRVEKTNIRPAVVFYDGLNSNVESHETARRKTNELLYPGNACKHFQFCDWMPWNICQLRASSGGAMILWLEIQ
jgi:hypothetical protein